MNAVARTTLIACVCLVLAACATSGRRFDEVRTVAKPIAADEARIYFYRTAIHGMAVQPEVKVNGQVVGRATPQGFFYVDRKPGAYEVTTTTEVERKLSLTLEKGQVRYVRLAISMGFFVGHVYPELVDAEIAERELRDMSYTGA